MQSVARNLARDASRPFHHRTELSFVGGNNNNYAGIPSARLWLKTWPSAARIAGLPSPPEQHVPRAPFALASILLVTRRAGPAFLGGRFFKPEPTTAPILHRVPPAAFTTPGLQSARSVCSRIWMALSLLRRLGGQPLIACIFTRKARNRERESLRSWSSWFGVLTNFQTAISNHFQIRRAWAPPGSFFFDHRVSTSIGCSVRFTRLGPHLPCARPGLHPAIHVLAFIASRAARPTAPVSSTVRIVGVSRCLDSIGRASVRQRRCPPWHDWPQTPRGCTRRM